jgi:hypothetical protein
MGIKRIIDTDLWNDSKVIDSFTPEDKYFMCYLLTNPYTTQLGIYELNKKKAAFELGYSVDSVGNLIERFEMKYDMIRYSKATNEIAIKNFLRHSIIKGGKPVEDLLIKELGKVKDKSLLSFIVDNLSHYDNLNDTVKKIVLLIQNDNDNDNENEVSYHDSYHDSSMPENKPESKTIKHKHGEYQNVLLKDDELEKLNLSHGEPDTQAAITYLDEYIEMKGYKAKSHYLAIKKWVFDAVKERSRKGGQNVGSSKQGGNGKPSTENTKRTPTITEMGLQAGLGTEDGDLPFMQ